MQILSGPGLLLITGLNLIQDCYLKCTENSQNSKIRKQMEKILANHISDKELILLNGKNIQGTHTTQ